MDSAMKIGMGQIGVEGGAVEANLGRAEYMIQRAADAGCDAVVLPECLDLGWTWPEARTLAEPVPGERSTRLAAAAKQRGVWVVAGLTERDGNRVFNCAILVSSRGELIAKHRKINELSIAHNLYDVGDRLTAISSPFGMLGVTICADNFPESLVFGHALARMGVRRCCRRAHGPYLRIMTTRKNRMANCGSRLMANWPRSMT
jgi:predicted amidohydrolase